MVRFVGIGVTRFVIVRDLQTCEYGKNERVIYEKSGLVSMDGFNTFNTFDLNGMRNRCRTNSVLAETRTDGVLPSVVHRLLLGR